MCFKLSGCPQDADEFVVGVCHVTTGCVTDSDSTCASWLYRQRPGIYTLFGPLSKSTPPSVSPRCLAHTASVIIHTAHLLYLGIVLVMI